MKFQLAIADRLRTVEVWSESHGYRVLVDGRPHLIDAVPVGAGAWSLLVRDETSGRPRSVEAVVIPQPGHGTVDVHIDGHRIPVHFRNGWGRRARDPASDRPSGTGPHRVAAPMPGKVVRVLVKTGDEVRARQGLVVVEAMKMENELRAARDGVVRDIFVGEGQSVEAGTTLVLVE